MARTTIHRGVMTPKEGTPLYKCLKQEFKDIRTFNRACLFLSDYITRSKYNDKGFVSIDATKARVIYSRPVIDSLTGGFLSTVFCPNGSWCSDGSKATKGKAFAQQYVTRQALDLDEFEFKELTFTVAGDNETNLEMALGGFVGQQEYIDVLNKITIDHKVLDTLDTSDLDKLHIYNIEHNHFYLSRSAHVGRVYNNLTNLPKRLRSCLRLNGSPLALLDVKSMQPYQLINHFKDLSERDAWAKIVAKGVYEMIVDYTDAVDRDAAKGEMVRYIGGCGKDKAPNVHRFMSKYFPIFSADFKTSKRTNRHSYMAVALQNQESDVMVDDVMLKMDIDCATIHDCLVVVDNPDAISKGRDAMLKAMTDKYGYTPTVDVDTYTDTTVEPVQVVAEETAEATPEPVVIKSGYCNLVDAETTPEPSVEPVKRNRKMFDACGKIRPVPERSKDQLQEEIDEYDDLLNSM